MYMPGTERVAANPGWSCGRVVHLDMREKNRECPSYASFTVFQFHFPGGASTERTGGARNPAGLNRRWPLPMNARSRRWACLPGCRNTKLKLIIGADSSSTMTVLVLLSTDREGYGNLWNDHPRQEKRRESEYVSHR